MLEVSERKLFFFFCQAKYGHIQLSAILHIKKSTKTDASIVRICLQNLFIMRHSLIKTMVNKTEEWTYFQYYLS